MNDKKSPIDNNGFITQEVKTMNVQEFLDGGFLQELNRMFLHPLGLALEVEVDGCGETNLGRIWDYRDDVEGVVFGGDLENDLGAIKKKENVDKLRMSKSMHRLNNLGFLIQPL